MMGEGRFTRPAACNFFYIIVSTFCVQFITSMSLNLTNYTDA